MVSGAWTFSVNFRQFADSMYAQKENNTKLIWAIVVLDMNSLTRWIMVLELQSWISPSDGKLIILKFSTAYIQLRNSVPNFLFFYENTHLSFSNPLSSPLLKPLWRRFTLWQHKPKYDFYCQAAKERFILADFRHWPKESKLVQN